MGLNEAAARDRLARFAAAAAGAGSARIVEAAPLGGGAIQENWAIEVELADGKLAGRHALVLRMDAAAGVPVSLPRAAEFALLGVARAAGVTVPEPLWLCTDRAVLGRDFFVMRRVAGTAAGHRIVRDATLGGPRDALAERLGQELARIHAVTPQTIGRLAPGGSFEFLGDPRTDPARDRVALYRGHLDDRAAPHPALEWGLRWAELNAPPAGEIVLTHQDFRTGNYLVDEAGLTAVLDWEFCAWGDPMADIGWFCAKCWRFGAVGNEAGGIAPRAPFYRGYERASGRRIDPAAVRYWEVMAHLRWAVIALQQADRHLVHFTPSLDLALTGRRPPELELEILDLIAAVERAA